MMQPLPTTTSRPSPATIVDVVGSNGAESDSKPNATLKRTVSMMCMDESDIDTSPKREKVSFREISEREQFEELKQISQETGRPVLAFEAVQAIHAQYRHVPTHREWSADENRRVTEMLNALGFGAHLVELNQMLPPGVAAEEANLFVWKSCAIDLNIDSDVMYENQQNVEKDKVKWSRRANTMDKDGKPRNGLQNKIARHNSCITDLEEPINDPENTVIGEHFVKHPHPKNVAIKYTNYGFEAFPELKKFRWRLAAILGPFGYKVFGQFFELNHYYDKKCGIGRHGDIERGVGDSRGMVNCFKLGYEIPLLFSWYHKTKPIGLAHALASDEVGLFPLVHFKKAKKWETSTVAAVVKLGHGSYYMMSGKAIGRDWKSSSQYTLRHCAGAAKYTGLPKEWYAAKENELATAYSLTGSDRVENDSESPELQFATRWDGK